MDNEIKTWPYDILNAIVEIESFFEDTPKILQNIKLTYVQNVLLKETLKLSERP